MKKRVHVYYSGRVQGVGFRLTAEETAAPLGVVGWVRNLRDGRVELVGEAEEGVVAQFLEALRTGPMRNFIQQVEVTWSASTGDFEEFEIRYC
jgi:acylphosphatase